MAKHQKGKTYEEMYGLERSYKIKKSMSINIKGKCKGKKYGSLEKRFSKEKVNKIKLKLGKGKTYEEMYGKEKAKNIKLKISEKSKRKKNNILWPKNRIRNVLKNIIKKIGTIKRSDLNYLCHHYNICSMETMRRQFGSIDNLSIECNINFKVCNRVIGTNEKRILDNIEKEKNIKLLRQYLIAGYYIDGYDKNNNVAYEVDEWHHRYTKVEDSIRENLIKEISGCKFVRIKE